MSSTDRQTDRRTDGQTDKVNAVYPPSNFVGRGYNNGVATNVVLSHQNPGIWRYDNIMPGGAGKSLIHIKYAKLCEACDSVTKF